MIIVYINIKESIKKENFVVETFEGLGKITKNEFYSGPLRNIDINNESNCDQLKKVLRLDGNVKTKSHKYFISSKNILKIFELVENYNFFYQKEKKLVRLKHYIFETNNNKIKSSTKITGGNDSNESYDLMIENLTIYFNDNQVIVNENTELSKSSYSNSEFVLSKEPDMKFVKIEPISVLKIIFRKDEVVGELFFDYGGVLIEQFSKKEYITSYENTNILRDLVVEERTINILLLGIWKFEKGNIYKCIAEKFENEISRLLEHNIKVLYENKSVESLNTNYNINISYNIDWFEVGGNLVIDEKKHDISMIYSLIKRNRKIFEIDNKIIFIPNNLSEILAKSTKAEGKLRLKKSYVGNLLEMSSDLKNINFEHFENLLDYKDITISDDNIVKRILREYQVLGTKWLLYLYNNHFGGCLADDMGLGKTIQVIAFLTEVVKLDKNSKNLIIVPKTLIFNWKKEISKFNNMLDVYIHHGTRRSDESIKGFGIIITTYGTVLNDIDIFIKYDFTTIIMDEYQLIKNYSSKTYKAINQLKAKSKIALTGTPIENNVIEIWSMMNILNHGIFDTKKSFTQKYGGIEKADLLKKKISPFVLRREKINVLQDLPDKEEIPIYCTMGDQQSIMYDSLLVSIKNEVSRESNRYEIKSNSLILSGLLYLREACCHPKLLPYSMNINNCNDSAKFDELKILIDKIYLRNEKVVIFSQFTKMLKIIEEWIKRKKYQYFYLDGKTNNRQLVVEDFEKSKKGIFLISLKAGGLGINLVSAKYGIIYDPWWNPAVEKQAEDRIYRMGQTKDVTIYKLITEGTIEEKVEELKSKKFELYQSLMNDQDQVEDIKGDLIKQIFS